MRIIATAAKAILEGTTDNPGAALIAVLPRFFIPITPPTPLSLRGGGFGAVNS